MRKYLPVVQQARATFHFLATCVINQRVRLSNMGVSLGGFGRLLLNVQRFLAVVSLSGSDMSACAWPDRPCCLPLEFT